MAWLIKYLIFIMQMLHKYEILQIAALENLTEAFKNIIKLSKNKPRTFSSLQFFPHKALSTIKLHQQNNK